MRATMRLAVTALLLSPAASVTAAVAAPTVAFSLAGHWLLNPKKTEDAREKMLQARGARDGGEPMKGAFFDPPPEMTIAQTDDAVTILVKDGGIREIHPKRGQTGSPRWTNDGLFVRFRPAPGHGAPRTHMFSVSKDGKELTEIVTLESRWGPVTVRRVYDAVSP
jgi:hypothetical protein